MSTNYIHLEWDGPYSYLELAELNNPVSDYGLYQVYGAHPIYGSDVLLYIGKAQQQTFKTRLYQEAWVEYNIDRNRVQFYIARVSGEHTPNAEDWNTQISIAEKMLIYANGPAANTSNKNTVPLGEIEQWHVLNWGAFRDILPEVSGARYSNQFAVMPNYLAFGQHETTSAVPQNV